MKHLKKVCLDNRLPTDKVSLLKGLPVFEVNFAQIRFTFMHMEQKRKLVDELLNLGTLKRVFLDNARLEGLEMFDLKRLELLAFLPFSEANMKYLLLSNREGAMAVFRLLSSIKSFHALHVY